MGHECELAPTSFSRVDGVGVSIDLPLFWYNPPWTWMSYRQADWVATAVAERRVIVSALWRDLSDDEMPLLHSPPETEDAATEDAATEGSAADHQDEERVFDRSPRMVPYRPERYGLLPDDFDHAKVIDVRLTVHRDSSGRFAYSPDQIQRWEATPEDSPHAGGGFVPAGTFPPRRHLAETFGAKARTAPASVTVGGRVCFASSVSTRRRTLGRFGGQAGWRHPEAG